MPLIEGEFSASPPITIAQVITVFVLGMALGELIMGPLSDAAGRRPAVIAGLAVFVLGTIVVSTADTFSAVVIGRFIQGVGVSGPKIGTRAMIRDHYAGTDMARVLSVIFTLLILVPIIAPAIGAGIAGIGGWRGLFWVYLVSAVGLGAWLWLRHPETLPAENRIPLQFGRLVKNTSFVLRRQDVTPVVVATGFVFGAQLVYFAVAADMFGAMYDRSTTMPLYFACLATGTGAALLLNIRYVGRTGMEIPILAGILLLGVSGAALLLAASLTDGRPAFEILLGLCWLGFFALGLLFGNLNALAMRPLGDLVGLSSSIIASVSSLVAFVFATVIERTADGPVWTVAAAFFFAAVLSGVSAWISAPSGTPEQPERR